MKVYFDPLSTSSRPVMLLIHDFGLDIEEITVNLHLHENFQPDFLAINPNGAVPVLEDDGFILTESSAILKYLARRDDLPVYPDTLREQIRVDEMVSWFTTNFRIFHGIFGSYLQMIPALAGLNSVTRTEMAALGAYGSQRYLSVLDRQLAEGGPYVCGDAISIADYAGISQVTLADFVDFDFSPYPNVQAWIALISNTLCPCCLVHFWYSRTFRYPRRPCFWHATCLLNPLWGWIWLLDEGQMLPGAVAGARRRDKACSWPPWLTFFSERRYWA